MKRLLTALIYITVYVALASATAFAQEYDSLSRQDLSGEYQRVHPAFVDDQDSTSQIKIPVDPQTGLPVGPIAGSLAPEEEEPVPNYTNDRGRIILTPEQREEVQEQQQQPSDRLDIFEF